MPVHERPLTIGMPVRNAEGHVAGAIDDLLDQTFRDFRLIISDNASEDATPSIIQDYADRDPRIEVVRHEQPLTAWNNFRYVFEQASSPYFMWAAHDDRRSRDYVEELLTSLQASPAASIAFGDVATFHDYAAMPETGVEYRFQTSGLGRVRKLQQLSLGNLHVIYGIMRRDIFGDFPWRDLDFGPDTPFLIFAALKGDLIHVRGPMFYRWVPELPKQPSDRARMNSYAQVRPWRRTRLSYACAEATARAEGKRSPFSLSAFLTVYAAQRHSRPKAFLFEHAPGWLKDRWRARKDRSR